MHDEFGQGATEAGLFGVVGVIAAWSAALLLVRFDAFPWQAVPYFALSGLIGTTGCPSGEVQTWLRIGDYEQARKAAGDFQDILGRDSYFLELMDHGLDIETRTMPELLRIAKDLGLPLVATGDASVSAAEGLAPVGPETTELSLSSNRAQWINATYITEDTDALAAEFAETHYQARACAECGSGANPPGPRRGTPAHREKIRDAATRRLRRRLRP